MCGIFGFLGGRLEEQEAAMMLQRLAHRGPDAHGLWHSPETEAPATLGHTRLSILDLSAAGTQPFVSACGNYVLSFNGEIYNFLELRPALETKGHRFRGDSDTEVLLYGLIEEGSDFLLKCNGMWSFCFYDRGRERALLARDRFGKKPLFHSDVRGGMAFASEMKALYPLLPRVEVVEGIDRFFRDPFHFEATEQCAIRGIQRIPPGHFLVWEKERRELHRWWNTLDHLPEVPSRYEEQVEAFRDLFLEAVRLRMRADVSIGTALSGGLDSSATFCAMRHLVGRGQLGERLSHDWQHAVCASFPGSSLDETHWARMVCEHTGVPLQLVETDPLGGEWTMEEALWQVEDPYLNPPQSMLGTYRAIAQAGVRVTLDGHGADELFSGYGQLRFALADVGWRTAREILEIQNAANAHPRWPSTRETAEAIARVHSNIQSRPLRRRLGLYHPHPDEDHPRYRQMDRLTQELYRLFHWTVLPTLLRNYDRYSMASGVEIRMPFMDYRLVCFVFALPWTSKVGEGFSKRILRDALKDILPEPIRTRRDKIGWNAPIHEWLRGPLRPQVEELIQQGVLPSSVAGETRRFLAASTADFHAGTRLWLKLLPWFWQRAIQRG